MCVLPHIHGKAHSDSGIIVGHRTVIDPLSGSFDNNDFRCNNNSVQNLADLADMYKPSEEILQQNSTFFNSLGDVDTVIVIGHSCSDVDELYFKATAANGTSASADDARKWFSKNGYTVTKSKDIEAVQARRWLSEGNLIFTIGFPGYYHVGFIFRVPHTCHAWVIDGYLIAYKYNPKKRTSDTHDYLHCNWGWNGYRNGYYLTDAFNTGQGSDFMDDPYEETPSDNWTGRISLLFIFSVIGCDNQPDPIPVIVSDIYVQFINQEGKALDLSSEGKLTYD